jgi:hypothetical protein
MKADYVHQYDRCLFFFFFSQVGSLVIQRWTDTIGKERSPNATEKKAQMKMENRRKG